MVLASNDNFELADGQSPLPSVSDAIEIERGNQLPATEFYNHVGDPRSGNPGDLVRSEVANEYELPEGVKAVRILYRSVGSEGEPVVASAAILFPSSPAPLGGWPIIAWAHGTSGVARQCAPSLMKNLYYGSVLSDMASAGFAIVAADYHGLGTGGRHRYMDRVAQANDIIHAIPASRQAVDEVGSEWVVCGHSQGGLAAWTVAEKQANIEDSNYRGAIAVAPATHLPRLLDHPEEATGAGYYFAWHAFAIEARYPHFKPSSMLSEIGMQHYHAVTSEGCWLYGLASYAGVDDTAMLLPNWNHNEWVRKFYIDCTAGDSAAFGPILVIAGEADTAVPVAGIRDAVDRARSHGQEVSFQIFPGLDHDPAMFETVNYQLDWIRDRLASKPHLAT